MKPVATVAFFLAVCLVLGAAEIDFSNPSSVTAAFKCAYPHFHLSRYRLVAGDRVALNMDEILNWITVPRSKLRTACCKLDNTLCDKTKKAGPAERADCESENGIACNVDMDAAAHGRNEMSGAIIAGVVLSALSLAGMLGGAGYAGYAKRRVCCCIFMECFTATYTSRRPTARSTRRSTTTTNCRT